MGNRADFPSASCPLPARRGRPRGDGDPQHCAREAERQRAVERSVERETGVEPATFSLARIRSYALCL